MNRIWLIGGTTESAILARSLLQAAIPCVVTVTTETARSLYPIDDSLRIWVGRLNAEALRSFLQDWQIKGILDASHPFAIEISQLAIASASKFGLPYLRYERPPISEAIPASRSTAPVRDPTIGPTPVIVPSFEALFRRNILPGKRVLLTIGYRYLPEFRPWQERSVLFVRILPSIVALETALAAGFSQERIIALRPPISSALEQALWQQWQISVVVTKASGTVGGEARKRHVATQLGVQMVIIDRPEVDYPQQTAELVEALMFCRACVQAK